MLFQLCVGDGCLATYGGEIDHIYDPVCPAKLSTKRQFERWIFQSYKIT